MAVSPIVMFISSCSATSTISVTPPDPLQGAQMGIAVNEPAQHQTQAGLSAVNYIYLGPLFMQKL